MTRLPFNDMDRSILKYINIFIISEVFDSFYFEFFVLLYKILYTYSSKFGLSLYMEDPYLKKLAL